MPTLSADFKNAMLATNQGSQWLELTRIKDTYNNRIIYYALSANSAVKTKNYKTTLIAALSGEDQWKAVEEQDTDALEKVHSFQAVLSKYLPGDKYGKNIDLLKSFVYEEDSHCVRPNLYLYSYIMEWRSLM